MFKIQGLPIGWAVCPPFVEVWLKQAVVAGKRMGDKVVVTVGAIKEFMITQKVPQVGDFIAKNISGDNVSFLAEECEEVSQKK